MPLCDVCGEDYSPFPNCDCVRRNEPVSMREGVVLAMFAGAGVGLVLSLMGAFPW